MILQVNYEEMRALRAGARALLSEESDTAAPVLAPPEERERVEDLLPRLDGDLSVTSLAELRRVKIAVDAIVLRLRVEMESAVVSSHAAGEEAVTAYFEFAHAFTVSDRVDAMVAEMEALIELMTGAAPTPASARDIQFSD